MYTTIIITSGVSIAMVPKNILSAYITDWMAMQKDEDYENFHWHDLILGCKSYGDQVEVQPHHVSAEFSLLHALKSKNQLHRQPKVVLFVTKTAAGKASAIVNKYFMEQFFDAAVEIRDIKKLQVDGRRNMNVALADFMKQVSDALLEGTPEHTCFAPLGGYKVMTTYGSLVGSFHGYPTSYLHEVEQYLHIIPPIPIDISTEFVESNIPLLREIILNGTVENSELHFQQQQIVKENPAIFETEDNLITLTPFGLFLVRRSNYNALLNEKIYFSEEVESLLKKQPDNKAFIFQQLKQLLEKLSNSTDFRGELFHEKSFDKLDQSKVINHLYKGASNDRLFRCIWHYDREDWSLYIHKIWMKKPYEPELLNGKFLYERKNKFFERTKEMHSY